MLILIKVENPILNYLVCSTYSHSQGNYVVFVDEFGTSCLNYVINWIMLVTSISKSLLPLRLIVKVPASNERKTQSVFRNFTIVFDIIVWGWALEDALVSACCVGIRINYKITVEPLIDYYMEEKYILREMGKVPLSPSFVTTSPLIKNSCRSLNCSREIYCSKRFVSQKTGIFFN